MYVSLCVLRHRLDRLRTAVITMLPVQNRTLRGGSEAGPPLWMCLQNHWGGSTLLQWVFAALCNFVVVKSKRVMSEHTQQLQQISKARIHQTSANAARSMPWCG